MSAYLLTLCILCAPKHTCNNIIRGTNCMHVIKRMRFSVYAFTILMEWYNKFNDMHNFPALSRPPSPPCSQVRHWAGCPNNTHQVLCPLRRYPKTSQTFIWRRRCRYGCVPNPFARTDPSVVAWQPEASIVLNRRCRRWPPFFILFFIRKSTYLIFLL